MKTIKIPWRLGIRITILIALLLGATFAYFALHSLSFDTVERKETFGVGAMMGKPGSLQPGLVLVTQPDDLESVKPYITDKAIDALSQLDFRTELAILAFQGIQSVDRGGDFRVAYISKIGHTITLYAMPVNRNQSMPGSQALNMPYHLIRLRKSDIGPGEFTFQLYLFGEGIVTALPIIYFE